MRIDSHHSYSERYPLDHLGTILKRNRMDASVLVTAEIMEAPEFVRAIVVSADPSDPDFPRLLDRCQEEPRFKGICCRVDGRIPEGLAELERRHLTLDLLGSPAPVPALVERFQGLRIAIDHLGAAGQPDDDWARDLAQAAQFPQVFCKLSGVAGVPRVYVRHAIAVFGPQRLMFGSDWPNGLPDITWKASLAAFTQAIGPQTIEFREELLGGTAARFYELPSEAPDPPMS